VSFKRSAETVPWHSEKYRGCKKDVVLVGYLLCSLFDLENGSGTFFGIVDELLPDCTPSHVPELFINAAVNIPVWPLKWIYMKFGSEELY
jgi:hypothetical protein